MHNIITLAFGVKLAAAKGMTRYLVNERRHVAAAIKELKSISSHFQAEYASYQEECKKLGERLEKEIAPLL